MHVFEQITACRFLSEWHLTLRHAPMHEIGCDENLIAILAGPADDFAVRGLLDAAFLAGL